MFDWTTMGAFLAVVIGLFLIPGPAVLLTATRTVQGGVKQGSWQGWALPPLQSYGQAILAEVL